MVIKMLNMHNTGLNAPSTPPNELDDRLFDVRLAFSNLEAVLLKASLLDSQGFWIGQVQDEALRLELHDRTTRLQDMLTRPFDTIQTIAQAHHCEAALRYAVHNDIASHLPSPGSMSYAALARKASVHEDQCRRILRLLISHQVFTETVKGEVAHTPASRQLLEPDVCAWVGYQTEDSYRSSVHLTEALQRWSGSALKTETAYNLGHDTELPMFEHMAQVGKIERFRQAMSGQANQPHLSIDHVFDAYSWSNLWNQQVNAQPDARPVVVDVGGGIGHVGSAISKQFPSFDVRVQDYGVTTTHFKDEVEFTHYNFFEPQPIKDADVYFMRQIFHDWSDEYAIRILQNQVAAMGPNSKLVIMDIILQQPDGWSLSDERKSRMIDVTMLTLFNAREREMSEWLSLIKRASEGRLHLTHLARPIGSIMSIMEFSFVA